MKNLKKTLSILSLAAIIIYADSAAAQVYNPQPGSGQAQPALPKMPPGTYVFKISPFKMNVPVPGANGGVQNGTISSDQPLEMQIEVK